MKKVFRGDPSTVAHMWANKSQSEATNGSNFYFDGDTIYSYGNHFPIAKHVDFESKKAVLFTDKTYSNTTAKHISIVKQSCNHLDIIYCASPTATHQSNFDYWLKCAEGISANLLKAKKPEKYLLELSRVSEQANKYASFFGLDVPDELKAVLAIENKDQYESYKGNKDATLGALKKKQEAALKRKHAKELKTWLSGKTGRLYTRDGYDYLRINSQLDAVETTQGVTIPMGEALMFWQGLKDKKINVGDNIGPYSVDAIGETTKIGCHTFKTDYLIKFGSDHFTITA